MPMLGAGIAWTRAHRRFVTGVGFALVTVTACVLVGRRLTHSSWPLAHAQMPLVVFAAVCYLASFVLRARGWRRLFPFGQQPDQCRCLASVGAAAALRQSTQSAVVGEKAKPSALNSTALPTARLVQHANR